MKSSLSSPLTAIFQVIWISRCQNVSTLHFIAAMDNGSGGTNWSYKACKGLYVTCEVGLVCSTGAILIICFN